MEKRCEHCGELKEHHAKGLCCTCYKKLHFKPKIISCKRCKRKLPLHAKGLCAGCYNYIFQLEKNKAYRQRRKNKISLRIFQKKTKECAVCGFNKIVDIHHLDFNKNNNTEENLIGLCPTHHRMINNYKFRYEIFSELQKKGFKLPFNEKIAFHKGPTTSS
jgi:hypothetical protein